VSGKNGAIQVARERGRVPRESACRSRAGSAAAADPPLPLPLPLSAVGASAVASASLPQALSHLNPAGIPASSFAAENWPEPARDRRPPRGSQAAHGESCRVALPCLQWPPPPD